VDYANVDMCEPRDKRADQEVAERCCKCLVVVDDKEEPINVRDPRSSLLEHLLGRFTDERSAQIAHERVGGDAVEVTLQSARQSHAESTTNAPWQPPGISQFLQRAQGLPRGVDAIRVCTQIG
jgi:hypothetical protein